MEKVKSFQNLLAPVPQYFCIQFLQPLNVSGLNNKKKYNIAVVIKIFLHVYALKEMREKYQ